jgi:hypothetical protein
VSFHSSFLGEVEYSSSGSGVLELVDGLDLDLDVDFDFECGEGFAVNNEGVEGFIV